VGDRNAFIVAETLAQARDAAVDCEPLGGTARRRREGWRAESVGRRSEWHVAFQLMIGDQAATDAAFAKAKHHVKPRIENNRLTPVVDGAARRKQIVSCGN
jgi:aerobic carbon-monoxide dehydrogenase large subunit